MSQRADVLFVVPPGLPGVLAHHEATSGMGGLVVLGASAIDDPTLFLYPPHTVAACMAGVRAAGLKLALLDAGRQMDPVPVARNLAAADAGVLAIMVSQGTAHTDEAFLCMLRQAGLKRRVLLFGPSAHLVAGHWLDGGLADAALAGEPEGAIADAVAGLAAGKLAGVVSAESLRPHSYTPGGLLAGLDDLPFPAWDAVNWRPYEMVSLLGSRGCAAGCGFCAYTVVQGVRPRSQSVERTLEEWSWVARTVAPPYVLMRDVVFAADRRRAQAVCEGLITRDIRIPWACESRPEHCDDDLLRLLVAAGCVTVKIGMESGDPELLAAIGRVESREAASGYLAEVRRVACTCARLGLRCRVFAIAGLPGETPASVASEFDELRRLAPEAIIHVTPYHAHPGTRLPGPSASVAAETIEYLRSANHPRPPLWRRAWRQAKGSGGIEGQGSRAEGQRGRGAEGQGDGRYRSPSLPFYGSPASGLAGWTVFLTGGNGFLGGHVAGVLAAEGIHVRALVRPGSSLGALADLPVEIVRGDLTCPSEWQERLRGCDFCFHVAAQYAGADEAEALYAVNVGGTNALLAACAAMGVQRVIHTSTVGTVGRPLRAQDLPDESTPFNLWDSASHYVRSKYLGECVARGWGGTGLQVVVVKPTAPVGAGDARPSATGRRILAALRGEVTSYPQGGINHCPVRDVAMGHLLAATRGVPGQLYILGHHAGNLDHAAFLRMVADAARMSPMAPPRNRQARGELPVALTANPARAVTELGLPQSDLRAAFAEAAAWYRKVIQSEEAR